MSIKGFNVNGTVHKYEYNALENAPTPITLDASLTMSNAAAPADKVGELKSAITDSVIGLDSKAPVIVETASGAIAHFTDGADSMPVKSLTIDGVESAILTRTGVNLFDKSTAVVGYIDDANGELRATQAESTYRSTDFVRVVGGQSYYIKTEQTASAWGAWYDENKQYIIGQSNYLNAVITSPTNAKYLRLTIARSTNGNIDTFGINYPSIIREYEPYRGNSFEYPTETVTTLFGVNNIWSDSGPVNVSYCADTKLYIDNKMAELQATVLENIGG